MYLIIGKEVDMLNYCTYGSARQLRNSNNFKIGDYSSQEFKRIWSQLIHYHITYTCLFQINVIIARRAFKFRSCLVCIYHNVMRVKILSEFESFKLLMGESVNLCNKHIVYFD